MRCSTPGRYPIPCFPNGPSSSSRVCALARAKCARHQTAEHETIREPTQDAERHAIVDVIGQSGRTVSQVGEAMLVRPRGKGPREHPVHHEGRRHDAVGPHAPGPPQRQRPQAHVDLDLVALGQGKRSAHVQHRHRPRRDARRVARVQMECEHLVDRRPHDAGLLENGHLPHVGGTTGRGAVADVW